LRIRINFNADPGRAFYVAADPDPAFHFNADPDPAPNQSCSNLRPFCLLLKYFWFALKVGIVLGRIEKFSFGDAVAGIIQPLEGDEKITDISKL
jgi:hypothetical protein